MITQCRPRVCAVHQALGEDTYEKFDKLGKQDGCLTCIVPSYDRVYFKSANMVPVEELTIKRENAANEGR